jgi:hypothetical protein
LGLQACDGLAAVVAHIRAFAEILRDGKAYTRTVETRIEDPVRRIVTTIAAEYDKAMLPECNGRRDDEADSADHDIGNRQQSQHFHRR